MTIHKLPQIVFTDLDGTLLSSNGQISEKNNQALKKLGQKDVIRVIVTGRSLFSFLKLKPEPREIDFLIVSTGAGILNWKRQSFLSSYSHGQKDIGIISKMLMDSETNFMVHHQIPENHKFTYYRSTSNTPDFEKRLEIYAKYATPYTSMKSLPAVSAQIIAIFNNGSSRFQTLQKQLPQYQVTRATSPLDHHSIWMEIFPKYVSKGRSCNWLCNHLGIDRTLTLAVGNDYNDISMLDFSNFSFVVQNAPEDLKKSYRVTSANDENGFAEAINATFGF